MRMFKLTKAHRECLVASQEGRILKKSAYRLVWWTLLIDSVLAKASSSCPPNTLSIYRVSLVTEWSEEKFPKQYPQWRPHAQWSNIQGNSHNSSYSFWRLGDVASESLKTFVNNGRSGILEQSFQGAGGIYDVFSAPPIDGGVGRTQAEFFADSNHSLVSLACRIIPSPDWFIGVSSLDMCVNGKWLDEITLDVDPLDAGTDNGFTFTAPRWETYPRTKISRITARHHNHPANSFYYPLLEKLPRIAVFQFTKTKTYELSEAFSPGKENVVNDKKDKGSKGIKRGTEKSVFLKEVDTNTVNYKGTFEGLRIKIIRNNDPKEDVEKSRRLRTRKLIKLLKEKRRLESRSRAQSQLRQCHVSNWSDWSSCSNSCGFGRIVRMRKVVRHGDLPCPRLEESWWCRGRTCQKNKRYFFW
ncbi:spondin-2-like [Tachypleus tridentatus]|uniref:spondin-2-like n=1 Tax=Tachypleus tridentatus TaxID=6853 RepID=UPI003FD6351F